MLSWNRMDKYVVLTVKTDRPDIRYIPAAIRQAGQVPVHLHPCTSQLQTYICLSQKLI